MGNLLFSPTGRIGPAAYFKAILIIAIAGFLIGFTALLGPLAIIGSLLAFVLFYCFIAVGIKRSHDAGKSGWMVIMHVLLLFGVGALMMMITGMVTGVSLGEMMSAAMSQDLDAIEEFEASTKSLTYILISGALGAIGYAITGYLINMFNKSELNDNRFGPATIGDS